MKILVIIVAYNNSKTLGRCIDSLKILNLNLKIVVVDNFGGVPESNKYELIKSGKNLGFAKGVNLALKKHLVNKYNEYDWVWLLNPDTLLEGQATRQLMNIRFDIFSPVIYRPDGKIWFAGGKIDLLTGECLHCQQIIPDEANGLNLGSESEKNPRSNWKTDWISGCSMFVRPEVFEKIGLFDEKFFLFYEDVDFCLRAKAAGFKIGVASEKELGFKVIHKISQSVKNLPDKKKYRIESASKWHFMKKHRRELRPSAFIISWARSIKHCIKSSYRRKNIGSLG